jgi:DNA-binding transcriptional regulator WhiA
MTNDPIEKYIELDNNPYLLGRVIVSQIKEVFNAEVDIIHKESHKIFKHVDIVYNQYSAEEALITGVQRLRQFLEVIEKKSLGNDNDETFH